jgi:toxin ParE1/3/4
MKVVVTAVARMEIREIGLYVARDDPSAAMRLMADLVRTCSALETAPLRGPVLAVRHGREVRRLVHGSYLILYTVADDAVRIHRVTHGARSPRLLLKNLDLP